MTTMTIDTAITSKQAAKRIGTPLWVIHDAIEAKKLPAIAHKKGYLLNAVDLEHWFDNLTPGEQAAVIPCTREGCYAYVDGWPHVGDVGIGVTPEGEPIHGLHVADSTPRDPDGVATHVRTGEHPTEGWRVSLRAVGNAAWDLRVTIEAKRFPFASHCRLFAEHTVGNAAGLATALVQASELRDKLNSKLGA